MIEFGEPLHIYGMAVMILIFGIMLGWVFSSVLSK